jgi:type I restriction enzyme S subunit
VSPDYAVFIPSAAAYLEYYGNLFTTELLGSVFRSASSGMGTGTQGFLRLYSESFLALWYPAPPGSEQQLIVSHIHEETSKIDALRAATERTIALLKERRSALIAAAVTGQIDVGSAA